MTRPLTLLAIALFVCLPALAATPCNLQISMSCTGGTNGTPLHCSSQTLNAGSSACLGEYFVGWFAMAALPQIDIGPTENSAGLTECFSSSDLGIEIDQPFSFCTGNAGLAPGGTLTSEVTITGAPTSIPVVAVTAVYDPTTFDELASVYAFSTVDVPSCVPLISAPPVTQSGVDYTVSWTAVLDPNAQFVVEESTSPNFDANVTTSQVSGLSKTFRHDVTAATTYYYRVRPTVCTGGTPASSQVTQTIVQAPAPPARDNAEATVPFGSTTPVSIPVFIPGPSGKTALADATFNATTDKPYLTVTPSSGPLPPQGTTVTVTANPSALPPGASTGTVQVTSNGAPVANVPVSISLVTPVTPGGKSSPPQNALIIPVVTHVNGAAGPFLSDVRLTNAGATAVKYQVTFTPTQTNATTSSKATQITVDPQQTVALNDIAKNFFGYGATGASTDVGFGALEIRPLNTSSSLTFAASRTYASTLNGTFGQFVAAVPLAQFATRSAIGGVPVPGGGEPGPVATLSLQQVAESAKFRTNLGITEGSGFPASGKIRIVNNAGVVLKETSYSLQPGEHQQLNRFIAGQGITNLEDGRIEVSVESLTGAVTAYASVLDNITTDPLAVKAVEASKISATRYVVPGMAELNNGVNNFHSDVRIYNGGTSDVTATLTYYPMNNGAAKTTTPIVIPRGAVHAVDNVLPTLFQENQGGGSLVVTTNSPSSLVATGRTYTLVDGGGTYGQFIPGVTPAEGLGLGDRPLQVLQLEQSNQFRSNVGLTELTGQPVKVKLSLHLPDSKVTPSVDVQLAANEFRQLNQIIQAMNPGQTYNARITMQVLEGAGRVAAYASVIDNESKDPTYVPAQ